MKHFHVKAGESKRCTLDLAKLYDSTPITLSLHVVRGKKDGPLTFVSAGIHGDEINGIEIARRLLHWVKPKVIEGTVVIIPIINAYGFFAKSRYLPDRRDLNRAFPGSPQGSLAGQVAHRFMQSIGSLCDYGIDLHSGASFRKNWPQVRGDMKDKETLRLAKKFGAPALLHSSVIDGSLRGALVELGKTTLLYEAGEALRVDPICVNVGLSGVLKVLTLTNSYSGKIPAVSHTSFKPTIYHHSEWLRAPQSGMFFSHVVGGDLIQKDQILGTICFPHSLKALNVIAPLSGRVIGTITSPLVLKGEAMIHFAY